MGAPSREDYLMSLSEAESQVLATLKRAESEGSASDRQSLEKSGERYWIFKEDWSDAYPALLDKGLISGDDAGYALSEAGRPQAEAIHALKPDMYWYYYQKFYTSAHSSAAHSELCRRVFGQDLTQEGQTDMVSLNFALDQLSLGPGKTLLDLGCGAGVIAEHVSEVTKCTVVGIDYSSSAIAVAKARTKDKQGRLTFKADNFNSMQPSEEAFDAILSMDTLYWASDMKRVIDVLARSLAPDGRMALFMNHDVSAGSQAVELQSDNSWLGRAIASLGLSARVFDFTANLGAFWERNYAAALALRNEFEAEGNGFIADSLIRESEEDFLPQIHQGQFARYLYVIDAPT